MEMQSSTMSTMETSTVGSSKATVFDDACFKMPLPPSSKKPRRGRGCASVVSRNNGHCAVRGRATANRLRPSGEQRVAAPAKFELHDIKCPHSNNYIGVLPLPTYSSICNVKSKCNGNLKLEVKEEPKDEGRDDVSIASISTSNENSTMIQVAPTTSDSSSLSDSSTEVDSSEMKTECASVDGENNNDDCSNNEGIAFVEEVVIDEFSLLLFASVDDEKVFSRELQIVRVREENERKRQAAERQIRIDKLKRKIRCKKRQLEKNQRLERKKQRATKRDRSRREKRARVSSLKKLIREYKANGNVVDNNIKKKWKAYKEECDRKKAEKVKRRVEHETRKDTRRAKRDRKRRRTRDASNKTIARKRRDDKPPKVSKKKMKSPGSLSEPAATAGPTGILPAGVLTAATKRPVSPSNSPTIKVARFDDVNKRANGEMAKLEVSCSTPLPVGVFATATPPSVLPPVRTPLSNESKPHTVSVESSAPSDPSATSGTSVATTPSSLFVHTSQAMPPSLSSLPLDAMRLLQNCGPNQLSLLSGANPAASLPLIAQMIQQQQALQQAQLSSARAQTPATASTPASAQLHFPPNTPLPPQLMGAAFLNRQAAASAAPKKAGRWCGMHVRLAMDIANERKALEQREKEARSRMVQQQPQTSQAMDVAAQLAMAAQQAMAARASQANCLPSTSTAPPAMPPMHNLAQTLGPLNGLTAQQLLALHDAQARRIAATPKPALTPQRPPSAMPRGAPPFAVGPMGLPIGAAGAMGLPQGLAQNLAQGIVPGNIPLGGGGSLTNGLSDSAQQQHTAMLHMLQQQAAMAIQQQQMQMQQTQMQQREQAQREQQLQAQREQQLQQQREQQLQAQREQQMQAQREQLREQQLQQQRERELQLQQSSAAASAASVAMQQHPMAGMHAAQQLLAQQQAMRAHDPAALLQMQMMSQLEQSRLGAATGNPLDVMRALELQQQQVLMANASADRELLLRAMYANRSSNVEQLLAQQRLFASSQVNAAAAAAAAQQQQQPATSTAPPNQLFNPALLNAQHANAQNVYAKLPFALPNGR